MIFKGRILGSARKFHLDSYLNGMTVLFDIIYGVPVCCPVMPSCYYCFLEQETLQGPPIGKGEGQLVKFAQGSKGATGAEHQ